MATLFTDNFNSYNDGDLNGQGSWSGDTDFDVQSIITVEGKAVKIVGTGIESISKTGTQLSEGRITVYHRRTTADTKETFPIRLYEDTTICTGVRFGNTAGQIDFLTDGVWVDSGYNFVADTWYCIEV